MVCTYNWIKILDPEIDFCSYRGPLIAASIGHTHGHQLKEMGKMV